MIQIINSIFTDLGVSASDTLTVTHIVVIFAFTMGLTFLGDFIQSVLSFGRSVKKF